MYQRFLRLPPSRLPQNLSLIHISLDSRATDELLRLFADVNRRGQTILMVTHSVKAASTAGRVLFIRDGEVYHQLYRGEDSDAAFYEKIAGTLTVLATGGDRR